MKKHECYGKMLRGNVYAERCCGDCVKLEDCHEETTRSLGKNKKKLDPKWVDEVIDYMIGPHMAVMYHKLPKPASELTAIIHKAVMALYEEEGFENTNEWVKAACDRVWHLYNTFLTAKLMKMFEDGVPKKSVIIRTQGSGSLQ